MKYLNRARVVVALLVWAFTLAFVIWPTGMVKRGMMVKAGADAAFRRRANAAHLAMWGARLAVMARWFIGLRIRVRLPDNRDALPGPYIFESNHFSALDALVMPTVAVAMGARDIRWVIKRAILGYPLLGDIMDGAGYAVVWRRKDAPDMPPETRQRLNDTEMDRYLRSAFEERVSIGIFPEGERFTGAKPGAKRQLVGVPTAKGFRLACERLAGYPVVSITVCWPPTVSGTTVYDVEGLCDQTVDVRVTVRPSVPPADAEAYLERSWDEKEEWIAASRAASLTA